VQDPPDMVRAVLPEPQSPAMQPHILRHNASERSHRHGMIDFRHPNLPAGGRWATSPFKGTQTAPTSGSIRLATRECGIAYGARALRRRRSRSSRGRHVPPGRLGKPIAGRRGPGVCGRGQGRYAQCRMPHPVPCQPRERHTGTREPGAVTSCMPGSEGTTTRKCVHAALPVGGGAGRAGKGRRRP